MSSLYPRLKLAVGDVTAVEAVFETEELQRPLVLAGRGGELQGPLGWGGSTSRD